MSEKKSPTKASLADEIRLLRCSPPNVFTIHWPPPPVHYDREWLKEENDRRSAQGLPPLQERKRKAVERERLLARCMIVSPMMAADINPDYELVPVRPETRRPSLERAKRALNALFPSGTIPDAVTIPTKSLVAQVNDWLAAVPLRAVSETTVLRAAGRRRR